MFLGKSEGEDFILHASFRWLLQGTVKHEAWRRRFCHACTSHDSWLISIELLAAVLPLGRQTGILCIRLVVFFCFLLLFFFNAYAKIKCIKLLCLNLGMWIKFSNLISAIVLFIVIKPNTISLMSIAESRHTSVSGGRWEMEVVGDELS